MFFRAGIFLLLLILCNSNSIICNAQDLKEKTLTKFKFTEHFIYTDSDTIKFYIYQKNNSIIEKVVLYLQGTTPIPEPFFRIEKTNQGFSYFQNFPSDYEQLDEKYAFIIIGLPGVPIVKTDFNSINLQKYHQKNSLAYRVHCANLVLDHISTKLFEPKKVIVYGHSEGAPVATKLATVNRTITHIGFWGGNALPDFFDFILFERKRNIKKEQSDSLTHQNIASFLELFNEIAQDSLNTTPKNTNEITEYTNKRWWSYSEPPINNLLKIDIPLFVQAATGDESAPIESNYLIPLEFKRLGKNNLTFKICIGCDHGFYNKKSGIDYWSTIFRDFIIWAENN